MDYSKWNAIPDLIILLGALQGFLFSFVAALSKKYRQAGNGCLVALILIFSLNNLQYLLYYSGYVTELQFYSKWFVPYQLLAGPLLLLYGLRLINPQKESRGSRFTFAPFIISILAGMGYRVFSAEASGTAVDNFYDLWEAMSEFASIILFLAIITYLWTRISFEISGHSNGINTHLRTLHWFRNVVIIFFVLTSLWLLIAVLSYVYNYEGLYYIMWLSMSVLIYWLGYIGIYKYGIEAGRHSIRNLSLAQQPAFVPELSENEHIAAVRKILVSNRRFLDPTITLDKIAEELGLSKSYLSRLVNTELKTGFPNYLNALRVEEAKIYLAHPDFTKYTLLAIGLEAGFNSKTTFNAAFRKATGQTPSEFKKAANR